MYGLSILGPRYTIKEKIDRLKKEKVRYTTEKSAVEELKKLINKVFIEESRDINRCAVFLSGGVDSALVAWMLKKNKVNVKTYTAGVENSLDIINSKITASLLNIPHKIREIKKNELNELIIKAMSLIGFSGPMQAVAAVNEIEVLKIIKKDGFDIAFTGTGVDTFLGGLEWKIFDSIKTQEEFWDIISNIMRHEEKRGFDTFRLDKLAKKFKIQIRLPFERFEFIEFARKLDFRLNKNNKYIFRKVALEMGLPKDICLRKKIPLQSGSNMFEMLEELAEEEKNRLCPDHGSNILYDEDGVPSLVRYYLRLLYKK